LEEGELVLLDAYVRGLTELEDQNPGTGESPTEPPGNVSKEQDKATSNG
jgi:hypothetical protein